MFDNLPEFDPEYLKSNTYGKYHGPFDRDYVGAFYKAQLPVLREKLKAAQDAAPTKTCDDGIVVRLPTQETVAYQRLIIHMEHYLRNAESKPLPNANDEAYKKLFSHERIERFPEHKRWEAALVYMIMRLSNQIHTVYHAIMGSNLPDPLGKPWAKDRQEQELRKLEDLRRTIDTLTDDINEEYFPFTCG